MALILVFHNDGTGPDDATNYDVRVQINQRIIAEGRVEGYSRSAGWEALVQRFLLEHALGSPAPQDRLNSLSESTRRLERAAKRYGG